ncbi:MAG: SAM-dependent methyltransferase [Marinoscillum sp.]|jgi:SAM-dependent methyltransferase
MNQVTSIYDELFQFESASTSRPYPIHKRLKLDAGPDILDWIKNLKLFHKGSKVLDAGCGSGYSLAYFHGQFDIHGLGISISEKEIAFAQNWSKSLDNIRFEVKSFDDPLKDKFEIILAIESLKHSVDLESTLKNLIRSLAEGGHMIIVDDFVIEDSELVSEQKQLWLANSFCDLKSVRKLLEKLGIQTVEVHDFTENVALRGGFWLFILTAATRLFRLFSPVKYRRNIDTFLGGLILEKLYRKGSVQYCALLISS